jgi:predicted dithiol-disulfide oxidoreductase (DUF899 family)
MTEHTVVSRELWQAARKTLLEKEKAFTRARDELAAQTRALPWTRVDKNYVFDGPDGRESLADLFAGKKQLIVYHFMYGPDWEEGCKSCSIIADHFDPSIVHLANRDVAMVAVSRGPLSSLQAFKKRMGWKFKWLSSADNSFNHDYQVYFDEESFEPGVTEYNYKPQDDFGGRERPGISVFFKDDDGSIYHTYSSYGRGLEAFMGVYRLLDVVPAGRDEGELAYGMEWVHLHDKY